MKHIAHTTSLLLLTSLIFVFAACGGGGGSGAIELEANPQIELDPVLDGNQYQFNLSQVNVGDGTDFVFDITNTGEGPLTVESLTFSYTVQAPDLEGDVPAFTCFYGDSDTPCDSDADLPFQVRVLNSEGDLPERVPVRIHFERYADDLDREASLIIRSDSKDDYVLGLTFTTGLSVARIQVSPERVEFRDVKKDQEELKVLGVRNSGSENLVIDSFKLDADTHFTVTIDDVDYVTTEDTRQGVTLDPAIELSPDQSIQFSVTYLPEDPQGANGTLEIHSNDETSEWTAVQIEAIQSGPILTVEPSMVEFGPRVVGREAQMTVQLQSTGTEPLVITGIYFDADATSPDFIVRPSELMGDASDISADNPLTIPANDLRTLNIYYNPNEVNEVDDETLAPVKDLGILVIENNSFEEEVEVEVSGYGVIQDCPVAVITCDEGSEVIPQTNLHLRGDDSYAMVGEVRKWEWRVEQPVGSQSVLLPSPTFPNPTFEANVAGTYMFYLDVWDEENTKSCEAATYEVAVIPDEAIHIELLWTTPGDPDETDTGAYAGADVDLHFIHPSAPTEGDAPDLDADGLPDPYFSQPYDCYWFNPHPDWGSFGNSENDDPGLDRDDTDGAGPENINLNVPENDTRYQVAIQYWNDHGYGASFVTVRVYIYANLEWEIANVRLINYDLWSVCYVDWPSGVVTQITGTDGGYRITPNYQHPMFFDK